MFRYIEKRSYDNLHPVTLFNISKGKEDFLHRISLLRSLDVHRGCVNSVVWDDSGQYLLSGSDDQSLVISCPWSGKVHGKFRTSHRANIFSARFIPYSSNKQVVSCSGNGTIIYSDLENFEEMSNDHKFTCHAETCYDVITVPSEPFVFMSCSEDGTVRWFDLRVKTSCLVQECKENILLNMNRAVTSMAINPMIHSQLAVATLDSTVHIFDRRMLGIKEEDSYLCDSNKALLMRLQPSALKGKKRRVTSLRYNPNGSQVLASFSSDYLYLFDIKNYAKMSMKNIQESESNLLDDSEPTLKRLRLRGDWSDTGPFAVPHGQGSRQAEEVGQVRPYLQSTLMQRMTDVLSRMLNATSQRAGGVEQREDSPSERNDESTISESVPLVESDRQQRVSPSPSSSHFTSNEEIPVTQSSNPTSSSPLQQAESLNSTNYVPPKNPHPKPPMNAEESSSSAPESGKRKIEESEVSTSESSHEGSVRPSCSSVERNKVVVSENRNEQSSNFQYDVSNQRVRRRRPSLSRIVNKVICRGREGKSSHQVESSDSQDHLIYYGKELQQYKGHRNARTMIKEACFWGDDYVMSGSDCGRIFVWDKNNGQVVMVWEADRHVVNCLQPHPSLPYLATSGIDYDIKLWAPINEESRFDPKKAEEIGKQNEELLAETRDTVTVPATFMIRMLATLNQLRRDRARSRNRNLEEDEEEDPDEEQREDEE